MLKIMEKHPIKRQIIHINFLIFCEELPGIWKAIINTFPLWFIYNTG